jgi:hypothetical protein
MVVMAAEIFHLLHIERLLLHSLHVVYLMPWHGCDGACKRRGLTQGN